MLKLVRGLFAQVIQSKQRLLRGHPTPPLHKTLAKAPLTPRHDELAVGPRVFLEKNVHARVIGLLLHLRHPLPGASKTDRAPHALPTRPKRRLDRALPLFQPTERLRDGDALTSLVGPRFRLAVHERQGELVMVEPFVQLNRPYFRSRGWAAAPQLPCLTTCAPYGALTCSSACDNF